MTIFTITGKVIRRLLRKKALRLTVKRNTTGMRHLVTMVLPEIMGTSPIMRLLVKAAEMVGQVAITMPTQTAASTSDPSST